MYGGVGGAASNGRAALITKLNERLDRTVRYPVQTVRPARQAGPEASQAAASDHVVQPAPPAATAETSPLPAPGPTPSRKRPKKKFRKVKQRALIQHEAHALANALLGRRDMPRIVETEKLWSEPDAGPVDEGPITTDD